MDVGVCDQKTAIPYSAAASPSWVVGEPSLIGHLKSLRSLDWMPGIANQVGTHLCDGTSLVLCWTATTNEIPCVYEEVTETNAARLILKCFLTCDHPQTVLGLPSIPHDKFPYRDEV